MSKTICFLAVVLLCGAVPAQEPETLRAITYNVQFLPGSAGNQNERPDPEYRARRIAEEVAAFDIVALQETFDWDHRQTILDTLRTQWNGELNTVISPQPDGFFTNGGCLIATRLPIVESDAVVYKAFSSPADYGFRADGFAAKGVIFARIARSADRMGDTIDVFVTHMEARADDLRPAQYKEMAAFIKAKSDPTRPMVLMGDLNTRGGVEFRNDPESQYSLLMAALQDARPEGVIDVWPALMGDALGGTTDQNSIETGKRIDYIIVGNPAEGELVLKPVSVQVNLYQDEKVVALSDHNAVEARFEWSDSSKP
ncbi:MAG: endonuclease/exonuclease/phosphatase family protein [Candidatus Hydrogenedentes bacterium]|nr:endonuclease/exonuclease/phosphatase family protein [Candidatus Hydrogenedentota bacterium]